MESEAWCKEFIRLMDTQAKKEEVAEVKIKEYINLIVPFAKELWNYGDGEGGLVIDIIIKTFLQSGLITRLNSRDISRDLHSNYRMSRLRKQVFERDAYRCKHCGDWHNLELDHIYPASKGGETTFENLQTLCSNCNTKKGAKIL